MQIYNDLAAALEPYGMIVRGGFESQPGDGFDDGRFLVLVGNAGPRMWQAFTAQRRDESDPLDAWTARVVATIGRTFQAEAVFPWSKPYRPFQQWAMRAEAVAPSPIGILIHPEYGLWHAYRAALIFAATVDMPQRRPVPSPCAGCAEKPCLTACPVSAFSAKGFDEAACVRYLHDGPGCSTCHRNGCLARAACPVGTPYPPEQIRFHMKSFYASRAPT